MGCVPSKSSGLPAASPGQPIPQPKPQESLESQPQQQEEEEQVMRPVDNRTFESRYKVKNTLGKGRYGVVKVALELSTGKEFAVKVINGKSLKNPAIIDEEVFKLKKVGNHPNVVSFYDFFKDESSGMFYIVMELCKGGDLFSRIVEDGSYSEKRAAELLRQLASALTYIHKLGITHRDLKPENILLSSKEQDACVKIVDFGLSKMVKEDKALMTTVIGTWAYCAPEVFSQQPYDNAVDTWALGILMFIMLSGYHPFDPYGELSDGELITRITNDDFDFDEPEWDGISEDAKFTIRRLLQKDPAKRMSLEAFLNTAWVTGAVAGNTDLSSSVKRMQSFSQKYRPGGPGKGDDSQKEKAEAKADDHENDD
jgi:serine/threonine protein kinase